MRKWIRNGRKRKEIIGKLHYEEYFLRMKNCIIGTNIEKFVLKFMKNIVESMQDLHF